MSATSDSREAVRIAVVTPELHRLRGTERATSEIVARLAQDQPICLFAHQWTPDGTPNICFHRVPVIRWPGLLHYLSFYAMATRAVAAAERRHGKFSAIYSPGPNCAQVQVAAAHFCQARQLELFRSGKHRPAPASLLDWAKLAHRWSYAWVVSQVEGHFYRLPGLQSVIAPSQVLARDLQNYYGLDSRRVSVAHNGVDCRNFNPEARAALRKNARHELELPDGQFTFLFIGNNWLIKGLQHAIRALAQVPDAQLLVVGRGYERLESWKKYSDGLGVSRRIQYVPRRPDVLHYYAAADALLAASVYDTFGMTVLEAMACGLPAIISRSMGVAEIAGPDDCLLVAQLQDAAELALAMQRITTDAALRAKLAANGARLAERQPWDAAYRAIAAELRRAAGQNAAAAQQQMVAAAP